LVQVSDFVVGTLATPDRAVPGDGDIPLGRIVAGLVDSGYDGVFDLEVIGPRIEAEGYEPAIRRGLAAMEEILGEVR
jgi:sugar phosphate isomerase/epimerase